MSISLRHLMSFATAATLLGVPAAARAQEPAPASAEPAPTAPPAAPPSAPVRPVTASAAPLPTAPEPTLEPITAGCSLGTHPGIDDVDARTAAGVVCHDLGKHGATSGAHEVRFGRLGGKVLVTLARTSPNYDERSIFVTGVEEVLVAGPRLVTALSDGKPVEDTRNVDNVVSSEAGRPLVQKGQVGFDGALYGTTALGAEAGASAGVALGLLYRNGNLGVGMSGRAGGIGSANEKMSNVGLDIGGRYYVGAGDVAPFVGGGVGLSYFSLTRDGASNISGSGLGAYAQAGVEVLRSHHTSLSLSLRADVPFYSLEGTSVVSPGATSTSSQYVIPLSLNMGIGFH